MAVSRHRFFGRDVISFLVVLPIALPGIVTGMALNATFTRGERRPDAVHRDRGPCHVLHRGRLQQRGRRLRRTGMSLEEAAGDLGAGPWRTFRDVTFPQMRTALVAGALLAFSRSTRSSSPLSPPARADAADLDLHQLRAAQSAADRERGRASGDPRRSSPCTSPTGSPRIRSGPRGRRAALAGRKPSAPGEKLARDSIGHDRTHALRGDPPALRRVLALAEGRRPVHRGSPRGGRVPHGRGAGAARQHVELHGRSLRAGARLRGLPGAPVGRARRIPARARGRQRRRGRKRAAVPDRPDRVRGGARRRPPTSPRPRARSTARRSPPRPT